MTTNLRHLAQFTIKDGFYGNITPLKNDESLFEYIQDKFYQLDLLKCGDGKSRGPSEISEDELLSILQYYTKHEHTLIVNTLEELEDLCNIDRYLDMVNLYKNNLEETLKSNTEAI